MPAALAGPAGALVAEPVVLPEQAARSARRATATRECTPRDRSEVWANLLGLEPNMGVSLVTGPDGPSCLTRVARRPHGLLPVRLRSGHEDGDQVTGGR